ncbi:MAG: hypothetical protein ABWY26_00050 [Microbacterium sp.]
MRSATTRHVIVVRLSLVGTSPEIWREVAVDRDLTLAHVRHVVQAVFDGPDCGHHLFTDSLDGPGWSRERRRWGDRWTMIDFRDPTVIDETTARIGPVLRDGKPLFFTHTCDANWMVEIEAGQDDVVAASDPPARVVRGQRRSPLRCSLGPYEHGVLVGVLDDRSHPDHDTLRSRIEWTVGPWATFDPEFFDAEAVQRALDGPPTGSSRTRTRGALDSLARRLPDPARAGLRAHLAATGLDLPVVVTEDEAAHMTRELRWVLERASTGGIPVVDGEIDTAIRRAGAEALDTDERRVHRLIAAARQLRLVYSRNGRLIAKRSLSAALPSPTALWSMLADALWSYPGTITLEARDLFLLAIADGTLSDPLVGVGPAAHAYSLVDAGLRDPWRGFWGDDPRNGPDCDERCDCPTADGATWHDIVAKSIRDAAASAAGDGAVAVASHGEYGGAGIRPEWVADATAHTRLVAVHGHGGEKALADAAASELLRAAAGLIDILRLFGLAQSDDGAWIVPATLREFARAMLQRQVGRHTF